VSNLVFAVPSYRRSEEVSQKTLNTLEKLGVPFDMVTIFVADEEDRLKYTERVPLLVKVVVGELGIGNQRRFINSYFEAGTRIVSLDDDVSIIRKNEAKITELDEPLISLVTKAFDLCDSAGLKFWGIPDTNNGFFMKHEWVTGFRGICGAMFGEYAQIPETQSLLPHSEDLEKAILHYLHFGGILRLNDVSVKQKRLADGGVNAHSGGKDQRMKIYREVTEELVGKYPDLLGLVNEDRPEKGLTKIRNKTTGRHPSQLSCCS
jgi:hypothetical protein